MTKPALNKPLFVLLAATICFLLPMPQNLAAQELIWIRTFNSDGPAWLDEVAFDNTGNIIIAGNADFSANNTDWIIIKYNPNGDILWTRTYDIGSNDLAGGVGADIWNNVIVAGKIRTNEMHVVKYSQDGEILWTQILGTEPNEILENIVGIGIDSGGNIVVAGKSKYDDLPYAYYYIYKLDPDGNELWSKYFSDLPRPLYSATDMAIDNNDNIIVTGYSDNNMNWDCYTVKCSSDGELLWQDRYDDFIDDHAYAVAVASNGDVYVGGELEAPPDSPLYACGAIVKYNAKGEFLWVKRYPELEDIKDIQVDKEDQLLTTGWYIPPEQEWYSNFFLAKLDSSGNILWTQSYDGGGFEEEIHQIAVDQQGYIAATGTSNGEPQPGGILYGFTFLYRDTTSVMDCGDQEMYPRKYSLEQNYPNPFNRTSIIEYYLPSKEYVELNVYDILGRHVLTAYKGMGEAGRNLITINCDNLQSGVYFYRLATGNSAIIRKLAVIK